LVQNVKKSLVLLKHKPYPSLRTKRFLRTAHFWQHSTLVAFSFLNKARNSLNQIANVKNKLIEEKSVYFMEHGRQKGVGGGPSPRLEFEI